METSPGFNLEHAVTAWLDGLEAQLRAAFAELRKSGIRDEEAFLLARLRVVAPQVSSADSFQSASQREWAPRVFWLLFGVFAVSNLRSLFSESFAILEHELGQIYGWHPSSFMAIQTRVLFQIPPLIIAGYWLVRGVPRFISTRLSSRLQVAAVSSLIFIFMKTLEQFYLLVIDRVPSDVLYQTGFVYGIFTSSIYSLGLIAAMVWLSPRRTEASIPSAQLHFPTNTLIQNQTPFNLDQAITAWRAELTRQPGLVPADLRELEAHLRDGFAELRQNQLSDQEAFLLAHLRVGSPEPVAAEYAKASPRHLWASKIFWLVFGLFTLEVWGYAIQWSIPLLWRVLPEYHGQGRVYGPREWLQAAENNSFILFWVPVLIAALWLARGVPQFVTKRLSTRTQVAVVGAGMFILANMHLMYVLFWFVNPWFVVGPSDYRSSNFTAPLWQLCLLVLMIWLAPNRAAAKARAVAT